MKKKSETLIHRNYWRALIKFGMEVNEQNKDFFKIISFSHFGVTVFRIIMNVP